jgi:hypothetical protein
VQRFGPFNHTAAAGSAYAIILKNHDASVSDHRVRNNFGFVLQGEWNTNLREGGAYLLTSKKSG